MHTNRKWNVANDYQHLNAEEHSELYKSVADQSALACINLSGDLNIGMMIRSASLFGIGQVYIIGRRKYDRRSSVGTHCHIPTERVYSMQGVNSEEVDVSTLTTILTELQKTFKLVFIEQLPHAYNYTEISIRKADGRLPPNTLFVFGSEASGLPQELHNMPNADYCIIHQRGIGRSLNVAVACGIILSEWRRND